MANIHNLKPFPKGVSGNPSGRKKGTVNFSTLIRRLANDPNLAKKVLLEPPKWFNDLPEKTLASAITVAMIIKAINGDVHAANWVVERGYGKEVEPEEIEDRNISVVTFATKGDLL
jgi:hypothetical protein